MVRKASAGEVGLVTGVAIGGQSAGVIPIGVALLAIQGGVTTGERKCGSRVIEG
jgi:hypothetical protein